MWLIFSQTERRVKSVDGEFLNIPVRIVDSPQSSGTDGQHFELTWKLIFNRGASNWVREQIVGCPRGLTLAVQE